jgi:hypothetical protein
MSTAKRATVKPATPSAVSSPLINAALVGVACGYGLWSLVARGRVSWPPHDLLASSYTVAGCLALVGPLVLGRRAGSEGAGLGELLWMTGGLLVWIFDAAAVLRGELRTLAPATPLGVAPMGLTMLAVLLAGWRTHGSGRHWSWTNVTGWLLGLFWVGMGLAALLPVRPTGLVAR